MPGSPGDLIADLVERAADHVSVLILFPRGPVMRAFLRLFERVGLVVEL